jgi:hypothetical protein
MLRLDVYNLAAPHDTKNVMVALDMLRIPQPPQQPAQIAESDIRITAPATIEYPLQ